MGVKTSVRREMKCLGTSQRTQSEEQAHFPCVIGIIISISDGNLMEMKKQNTDTENQGSPPMWECPLLTLGHVELPQVSPKVPPS